VTKSSRHDNLDDHWDVVIVGGAVIGSSVAYFLTENTGFDGSVLVVEPDPTYEQSSTTLSLASIRHQFSKPINIEISMFGTDFARDFHGRVEVEGDAPDLAFRETGYMFCAAESSLPQLRRNVTLQQHHGADVKLLNTQEVADRFPYLNVDDLAGCSLGETGEGTLDAYSLLMGFKQRARHNGAVYTTDRVSGLVTTGARVTHVDLASGQRVGCDYVVNAAGTCASHIASLVGLDLPVEPRRRSVFVFACDVPIERRFPLTVDTTGVHVRTEGPYFVAGGVPPNDTAVETSDFAVAADEFYDQVWPALAHRIPQFDRIKLLRSWAGHYAYNTLDQNAVVGAPPQLENFLFANGFSGHGLQQAPAVGRGISELVTYGSYRSLDLSDLGYERILNGEPFVEEAII